MKIVVIYEQDGPHFGAYLPNFPGCVATGDSFEEVRENIRSAISMHFPRVSPDVLQFASQQVIAAEILEISNMDVLEAQSE
jgi:predicted RNase H-like HicB family nuclease